MKPLPTNRKVWKREATKADRKKAQAERIKEWEKATGAKWPA